MLEPPRLRIPTNKVDFTRWGGPLSNVRANDIILSCTQTKEDKLFCPQGAELHSWDHLEGRTQLDFPSSFFDVCYLTRVLEYHDWDGRLALVREGLRVLKPGGQLLALSVACNDQEELYKLACEQGLDVDSFANRRLMNRDIGQLKPNEAAFFRSVLVIPSRKRLVTYMREQGLNGQLSSMWGIKGSFPINRLSVGLKWIKDL